jgi:hypothetical protein
MYVGLASPTEPCVRSELAKVQGVHEIIRKLGIRDEVS